MSKRIFVTGIGTEIGKTFCSAILVEALKADYWKPVQAGELDALDSDWVKNAISNTKSHFHSEQFLLSEPMSPHAAARIDGLTLKPADFKAPHTNNALIIEGAGGVMVPINDDGDCIVDLIPLLADEAVVISKNYLGSINHTLLTVELLQNRNIPIKGIIFNGPPNAETEAIVLKKTGLKCLGKVPELMGDLKGFIKEQAAQLQLS